MEKSKRVKNKSDQDQKMLSDKYTLFKNLQIPNVFKETFGTLFQGLTKEEKKNYILVYSKKRPDFETKFKDLMADITTLNKSPNSIKLLDQLDTENNVYLVFDYFHTDLLSSIKDLNQPQIINLYDSVINIYENFKKFSKELKCVNVYFDKDQIFFKNNQIIINFFNQKKNNKSEKQMKGIFLAQLLFKQNFSLEEDFQNLKSQFIKLLTERKIGQQGVSKLEVFFQREPIQVQQISNEQLILLSQNSLPQNDNSQSVDQQDQSSEPNNKTLKFNKICINQSNDNAKTENSEDFKLSNEQSLQEPNPMEILKRDVDSKIENINYFIFLLDQANQNKNKKLKNHITFTLEILITLAFEKINEVVQQSIKEKLYFEGYKEISENILKNIKEYQKLSKKHSIFQGKIKCVDKIKDFLSQNIFDLHQDIKKGKDSSNSVQLCYGIIVILQQNFYPFTDDFVEIDQIKKIKLSILHNKNNDFIQQIQNFCQN